MRRLVKSFRKFCYLSKVEFLDVRDFLILAYLKRIKFRPECFGLLVDSINPVGEFSNFVCKTKCKACKADNKTP